MKRKRLQETEIYELWKSLPPELWINILLRLSIKDVLSCRSISKFFVSIIDDPEFAVLHYPRHAEEPLPEGGGYDHIDDGVGCQNCKNPDHVCNHVTRSNVIVIDRPTNDGIIKGGLYVTKFGDILTPSVMFKFLDNWGPFKCDVVGTVNGLLLLHKYECRRKNWSSRCELILWNPLTGKTLTIPKSPLCLRGGFVVNQPVKLGFGYDADNNDYKIVAVVLSSVVPEYTATFEVFNLRTKSWSTIWFSLECGLYFGPKINGQGSIIWLAGEFNPNGSGNVEYNVDGEGECDTLDDQKEDVKFSRIIPFHLGSEELRIIKLPNSGNEGPRKFKFPVVYNKKIRVMGVVADDLGVEEWHTTLRGCRVSNAIELAGDLLVSVHGRGLLSFNERKVMVNDPSPVQELTHHPDTDFVDVYVPTLLSPSNPFGSKK